MDKIYVLKDPTTNEIKYVGQTSLTLYRRLTRHVSESLTKKEETPKRKWIKELIQKELCPIIELVEVTKFPNERELYWIKKYKSTILNLEDLTKYSKPNSKKVFGLDIRSGKVLEFINAKTAALITGTSQPNLVKAIHSKKQANGYLWNYSINFKIDSKELPNKVILTSLAEDKKFIFSTKKEAIEFTNGTVNSNKNGADFALENKGKEYRGFYWDYAIELVKSSEFRETPIEDNPEPSTVNDNLVTVKVQRLMGEESTNKPDTSAGHSGYNVIMNDIPAYKRVSTFGELIMNDDIV